MGATARNLDFTNVKEQSGFNPRRKPEGDYKAKIVSVDDHTPKDDATKAMWVFTIQLDDDARAVYPYYCGLDDKQLWKVRNLFVAAGIGVPKKRVKADPNKVVGKDIGIVLEDDEYEGRPKSVIAAVLPVADLTDGASDDDDDDDEETPAPKKRASKKAPEPEPDDDEDEEPPAPKKRNKAKPAPEPEADDDEEEDDDEPAPVQKRRIKAKTAAPAKKPPVEDDDDEDDDLDLDEL